MPSLAQLDEAVRAITEERQYDSVTVIVDATFAHRIDEKERAEFEAAVRAGEVVTPPAGAIGRGDAFILQVAEKVGAVVLSNDSFQEFHGEHDWLFEEGRLIGGKPIEGVGWVFVDRAPVRGPASRRSVRKAESRSAGPRRKQKKTPRRSAAASGPVPKPTRETPPPRKKTAAPEADETKAPPKKTRRKKAEPEASGDRQPSDEAEKPRSRKKPEELNDPRTFVQFVSQYSIGDDVEGVVERFSSHGCYVRAATAQCYLPSRAMGDPPPSRARDVVSRGQTVIVKVESLDSDRRGINVSLVRAVPREGPVEEQSKTSNDSRATANRKSKPAMTTQERTAAADGDRAPERPLTRRTSNVATSKSTTGTRAKRSAKKTTAKKGAATATASPRVKRATAAKAASKKRTTAKKTTAKKTPAKKTTAKKTTKKAPAKKTTAKKTTAKKAPAKKTTAKKTTAKKAPAKKTTKATAKKAPAKKATATS